MSKAVNDNGLDGTESRAGRLSPIVPERRDWRMLGLSWLMYFCFSFTVASLFPIIGSVRDELGISYAQVGVILGVWQLVYLGAALPIGALVDRYSSRSILFAGAIVVATSQLARSFAHTFPAMLAAVALLGLGGPVMSVGLPKVIAESFDGKRRALASGIYVTGAQVGQMTALALTNVLAVHVFDSWRVTLRVYAVAVTAAAFVWLQFARGPAPDRTRSTGQRQVIQGLRHIVRLPDLRIVVLIGCSGFLASHGYRTWLPELFVSKGFDATDAGFLAAVPAACGVVGSIVIVRFAARRRLRKRTTQGLLVITGVAIVTASLTTGPLLVVAVLFEGFCAAALMPLMMNTLMEMPGIGARYLGAAAGLYFSLGEIGGFVGPTLIGVMVSLTGSYVAGMSLLAGVMWLMLFAAARLPRDPA